MAWILGLVRWLCAIGLRPLGAAVATIALGGMALCRCHELKSCYDLVYLYQFQILLGCVVVVWLAWHVRAYARDWRPLPDGKLAVAICDLVPNDPGDRANSKEAVDFPGRLQDALRARDQTEVDVATRRHKGSVEGVDDEQRASRARAAGRRGRLNVHAVIWGDVRRDDKVYCYRVHVSVARQLRGAEMADFVCTGKAPVVGRSDTDVVEAMADTVGFVYALALYRAGMWDKAAAAFKLVRDKEARLHEARARYRSAVESSDQQAVQSGLAQAETLVREYLGDADISLRNRAIGQLYLGDIHLWSAARLSVRGDFDRAIEAYGAVLCSETPEDDSSLRASAHANLGNALGQLGRDQGGKEGRISVRRAIWHYRVARRVSELCGDRARVGMANNNTGAGDGSACRDGQPCKGPAATQSGTRALRACTERQNEMETSAGMGRDVGQPGRCTPPPRRKHWG